MGDNNAAIEQSASAILASATITKVSPSELPTAQADLQDDLRLSDTGFSNFSTVDSDKAILALNSSTTGCYRRGALPVALGLNDTCNLGFFCPNSTNEAPPQYCPPAEACQVARSARGVCSPQGVLEPVICPAGHYCPEGGKQQIPCAKGTFCPQGSFQPRECDRFAICPAESVRQIPTVPFGFMIAIDVLLALCVAIGFGISRWHKRRRRYASIPEDQDSPDFEKPPTAVPIEEDDDFHSNPDYMAFLKSISKCVKGDKFGLSFDFDELTFEPKPGKRILSGICGTIVAGSFWGIMGGSGAGKSTFVNVLMGKTKQTGGYIKVNGYKKDMTKYKKLIGYVPQDDIVLPELTVRENILHSARMRLPSSWKDREIREHVDNLLSCLQLTHVQHSLVGDAAKPIISGGQRKRVSIGMELAAAPMAIFLDEPTSGLDATSAASIMKLLKSISRLGVTTIAIIHQPREQIYHALDNLLLLGNGRQIYAGPTMDASSYFGSLGFAFPPSANPADTIMDIITGNGRRYNANPIWGDAAVPKLIEEWERRMEPVHLTPSGASSPRRYSGRPASIMSTPDQELSLQRTMKSRGATWPAQVFYCLKRAVTQQIRNSSSFFFEICVGAFAGGVIGLSAFSAKGQLFRGIYHPPFTILSSANDYVSIPQIALLGAVAIGLAAAAPGCRVFGEEKLIYWRETAAGHSRSAYYVGKILSTLVRICLSALHFTVFLQLLATPMMSFTEMYVSNLLYFYCIYGLAACISMMVKREDGPLLSVMASLIVAVLSGVAPTLNKVHDWNMEWLWRMSPGTWYAEAFVSENLLPLDFLYILSMAERGLGFKLGQFSKDMLFLFVIGTIYRFLGFVLLILLQRRRKA